MSRAKRDRILCALFLAIVLALLLRLATGCAPVTPAIPNLTTSGALGGIEANANAVKMNTDLLGPFVSANGKPLLVAIKTFAGNISLNVAEAVKAQQGIADQVEKAKLDKQRVQDQLDAWNNGWCAKVMRWGKWLIAIAIGWGIGSIIVGLMVRYGAAAGGGLLFDIGKFLLNIFFGGKVLVGKPATPVVSTLVPTS
jgi:hypothetical protein